MENTLNPKLVRGRVGDLTDSANPLTFSLIQKIFGFEGPYRKVLSQFGIGNLTNNDDYLTLKDGIVYSDIQKENEILWQPTGYEIKQFNNKTSIIISLLNHYFPQNIIKLLKKTLNEIRVIQNPNEFIDQCFQHYTNINSLLEKKQKATQITPDEFLNNYQNVIYISYINEVLQSYFKISPQIYQNQSVINYVNKHEAMLASPDTYFEQTFSQLGFTLGELPSSDIINLPLIPDSFPRLNCPDKPINYVITMQCIRNNTRLKINALLYFLNSYLFEKSNQNADFGYLTIDEIDTYSQSNNYDLESKITSRKTTVAKIEMESDQNKPIDKLIGIPCSAGIVSGKLQVVNQPNESITGNIVVFPNASPTFTQQFRKSKGLIFKVGSPLSHGSIIAREMNVPAVVIDYDFSQYNHQTCTLNGLSGELNFE